MSDELFDSLDEHLSRIFVARQRPAWRRRLLAGLNPELTFSGLRALRAVERRSTAHEEVSVRDVAEEMGLEHSTASRIVANNVEAGLIAKTQSAADQRKCLLILTAPGEKILAQVTIRRRTMVAEHVSDWPEADANTLTELLGRLAHTFETQS